MKMKWLVSFHEDFLLFFFYFVSLGVCYLVFFFLPCFFFWKARRAQSFFNHFYKLHFMTLVSLADVSASPHTNSSFFEGDIKLTEEQRMNNDLFGDPERSSSRAATNVDKIKWPNGIIPYEFDCSVGKQH